MEALGFNVLMEGPITYQIVAICFTVGTVCTLVVVWFFSMFQTKRAAIASERSLRIHIDKVEADVEKMQTNLAKIGSDVSYIRGRLEPRPQV